MFDDASLCTWGRPGGCGLGFDLHARTRTGVCLKRQSFSDVLSDHSALCTWGRPGGCGLGFDLHARTRTGMCLKRQSFSDVLSDHSVLCAGGNGCLLGSLQLSYGVEVRLVAAVVAGPVGLELAVG